MGIDSFLTSVGTCKIITTWQPKFALMCREVALRTSSERRAAPSDCVSDYSAAAWASRRLTGRRLLAFQRWSENETTSAAHINVITVIKYHVSVVAKLR